MVSVDQLTRKVMNAAQVTVETLVIVVCYYAK